MNLSITIIGHNEIEHLRELLPQLKWADEIVYVDCESNDGSLEVVREAGCRVYFTTEQYQPERQQKLRDGAGKWGLGFLRGS